MRKQIIHFEVIPLEVAVKVLRKGDPAAKREDSREMAVTQSTAKPRKARERSKKRKARTL